MPNPRAAVIDNVHGRARQEVLRTLRPRRHLTTFRVRPSCPNGLGPEHVNVVHAPEPLGVCAGAGLRSRLSTAVDINGWLRTASESTVDECLELIPQDNTIEAEHVL